MFTVYDLVVYFASHKLLLTLSLNLFNVSIERHDELKFPTVEKKPIFEKTHEICGS